ncbi:MAG: IPT/TIG domain-containing protein [Acidobacteria bacterium]|nr:IPT/TIG domain-containing protein [Acidobacteriota bacterium]
MKLRKTLPALALVGLALAGLLLAVSADGAQGKEAAKPATEASHTETRTAWGLHTTTFDTLHGRVVVNLPADLAAGDTISGTVYAEPKGNDEETRAKNLTRLEALNLTSMGLRGKVGDGTVGGRLPVGKEGVQGTFALRTADGETVGQGQVPVSSAAPTTPTEVVLPEVAQAGRPVTIRGPFDGNAAGTSVEVGGEPATLLAESPRGVTFLAPTDAKGSVSLKVREQSDAGRTVFEAEGTLRVLSLELSADSVKLKRGQSTGLEVRVSGLEGLEQPIPLRVRNLTPSQVRLEGGDAQTVSIPPSGVSDDGSFLWQGTLSAARPGSFEILAAVPYLIDPPWTSTGPVADALQDPPSCRCQRVDLEDGTSASARNTIHVEEWKRSDEPVGITLTVNRRFLHRMICGGDEGKCQASTGWQVTAPVVTLRGVRIGGEASEDLSSAAGRAEQRLSLGGGVVGYEEDASAPTLTLEADCSECRRLRRRECKAQLTRNVVYRLNVQLPVAVLGRLREGDSVTFSEIEVSSRWGGMARACGGAGFMDPVDTPHTRVDKRPSFTGWK